MHLFDRSVLIADRIGSGSCSKCHKAVRPQSAYVRFSGPSRAVRAQHNRGRAGADPSSWIESRDCRKGVSSECFSGIRRSAKMSARRQREGDDSQHQLKYRCEIDGLARGRRPSGQADRASPISRRSKSAPPPRKTRLANDHAARRKRGRQGQNEGDESSAQICTKDHGDGCWDWQNGLCRPRSRTTTPPRRWNGRPMRIRPQDKGGQQITAQIRHDSLCAGVSYHRVRRTRGSYPATQKSARSRSDAANLARAAASPRRKIRPRSRSKRDQIWLTHHQQLRHDGGSHICAQVRSPDQPPSQACLWPQSWIPKPPPQSSFAIGLPRTFPFQSLALGSWLNGATRSALVLHTRALHLCGPAGQPRSTVPPRRQYG